MDQHEEQAHDVYGGDIPDEGEMLAEEEEAEGYDVHRDPNAKDLEDMKRRLKEIEEEAGALREMQAKVEKEMGSVQDSSSSSVSQAEKEEVDSRSIYVGNVDYSCTPEEVQQHFQSCGTVNRVTILTDKFGQPKGFAYIEFVEIDAVQNALLLNESEFHGHQLKVSAKRTNIPGMKQYRGRRPNPHFGLRSEGPFMPAPPFHAPSVNGLKNVYKDPDDGRQRFLLELEFVQCLANPTYIHYLAQNRYFEDEAFVGYLKYLQYWQRPEYIKFIMYPHCLFFLELLQNANFRNAMAHPGNKELAHRQQFFYWKNYRNNRLKHILPRPLPEPVAALPAPAPPPPQPPVQSVPPTTISMVAAPPQVHSPLPYGMSSGSAFAKNDMRSSGIDRRKRKKEV